MSNSKQFRLLPVTSIVNYFSAGNAQSPQELPSGGGRSGYGGRETLSGELTANTYKEIVGITGAGVIDLCYASTEDVTSRTVGIKIVIDGVTVFDAVSSAITTSGAGIIAVGLPAVYTTAYTVIPQPVAFAASLSIWIKSSLNETDKVKLTYSYQLT